MNGQLIKDADPIAVIGLSGRFPQAADVGQFWENLAAGKDCITEIPHERWDVAAHYAADRSDPARSCCKWGGFIDGVDAFDPLLFQLDADEAQRLDPQQRLYLEAVWTLLEDSGYTREILRERHRGRVGVYVGAMQGHAGSDGDNALSNASAAIANRVSYFFGLHGPSVVLDTMCSSAAMALHTACNDLRMGLCELAIAGGVNLTLHPRKYLSLSRAELLSSDPRGRSFGVSDGYLPAEAIGAVLLKPLAQATADGDEVWGVIRATAVNHSGRSTGYAVPDPAAQAQVMRHVLELAGIAPESVGYVEAAARGLARSDAIEVAALESVFGAAGIRPVGTVTSSIGHAEAASAVSQLAKVLLQMRHGLLAPSMLSEPLNPAICFAGSGCELQRQLGSWPRLRELPRRALVNSFGVSGCNVSLLIEEHISLPRSRTSSLAGPHAMVFSARDATALRAVVSNMLRHLRHHRELELSDLAYTLQCGREALASRLALIVKSHAELLAGLEAFLAPHAGASGAVPIFTGSGAPCAAPPVALLRDRDLGQLATYWVQGGNLAWADLYGEPRPRLRRLPTYPFTQVRYWSARRTGASPAATGSSRVLHPLLHTNTSDFEEYRFSSSFNGAESFAWRDQACAAQVLPESIYLEMPCAAVQRAMGRGNSMREGVRLRRLEWRGALYVPAEPLTVHIALRPDESELIAYEIFTDAPSGGEILIAAPSSGAIHVPVPQSDERLMYSRGYALLVAPVCSLPKIDLPTLRARCNSVLDAEQWYELLRQQACQPGTSYRDSGSLLRGMGANGVPFALVELAVPTNGNAYRLHPIPLSMVLQAATSLIDEQAAAAPSAANTGWAADELWVLAPLSARVLAHVQLNGGEGATRSVDIDIYDPDGAHLARLQRLRRLAAGRPACAWP